MDRADVELRPRRQDREIETGSSFQDVGRPEGLRGAADGRRPLFLVSPQLPTKESGSVRSVSGEEDLGSGSGHPYPPPRATSNSKSKVQIPFIEKGIP